MPQLLKIYEKNQKNDHNNHDANNNNVDVLQMENNSKILKQRYIYISSRMRFEYIK